MSDILLDYREILGWFAEVKTGTRIFLLEMSDVTFQRHVEAYLQQQGIDDPTSEQRMQARQYCRRLSFWEGCNDSEIRWRVFGGHREQEDGGRR